jgi:hypothetical protein
MGKAGEKQKRTPKTKDKRQYERFVETARKLGCDESEEAFEHEFTKIVPPRILRYQLLHQTKGAKTIINDRTASNTALASSSV